MLYAYIIYKGMYVLRMLKLNYGGKYAPCPAYYITGVFMPQKIM